jgi:uncharacterized protein (DUF952 family)
MTRIYKILSAAEWDAAKVEGRFTGSAVDHKDGYIHLSTAAQAGDTARLHFAGQTGLVLLELVAEDFGADLKWEPSRGGSLFPHLYIPLDPTRVRSVQALALNADGWPDPGPLAS